MMITKTRLVEHLNKLLDIRISEIRAAISLLKESRDNESKSSAGDKYETGRAMAQIELDKLVQQLQHQIALQEEVIKVQAERSNQHVGFGSLVSTSMGLYFVAIGLGKLQLEDEMIYVISLASPIGQALKGTQKGDTVSFNGNTLHIIDVI